MLVLEHIKGAFFLMAEGWPWVYALQLFKRLPQGVERKHLLSLGVKQGYLPLPAFPSLMQAMQVLLLEH